MDVKHHERKNERKKTDTEGSSCKPRFKAMSQQETVHVHDVSDDVAVYHDVID